jgi:hypothetical protein
VKIKENKANAKRAYIQMLLYLGLKPVLKVLEAEVPGSQARDREVQSIKKHRSRYLLNSRDGGEGVTGKRVSVYALLDPRSLKVFYVGIAIDPNARFKQHLRDARIINGIVDRIERDRMPWTLAERELIFSGSDTEATARALGRTVQAVRSHLSLMVSTSGHASKFVTDALQAAFNMHKAGKLKCPPSVQFYSAAPNTSAKRVPRRLTTFAQNLRGRRKKPQ